MSPPPASNRPPHVRPPAHLTPSPPVPAPAPVEMPPQPDGRIDPVRYGDWELKGVAVDF